MTEETVHPENESAEEAFLKTPMVAPKGNSPVAPALLCAMGVFFLVMNVVMLTDNRVSPVTGGLILGVIAAETTLLAVFAALAPFSLFVRVALSTAGVTFVCVAAFHLSDATGEERLVFAGVTVLQWIAVQIPLWMFRLRSGWCLRRTPAAGSGARLQDLQFGIRQLLAWTAVVAAVLSIAKTTIASGSRDPSNMDPPSSILVTLILVVFNSLAAWPMIWAAFVRSRMFVWCGVALACSAILCAGEIWSFRALFGPGLNFELFFVLHGIQALAVGGSLLLVRWNGIRLTPGRRDIERGSTE